MGLLLLSALCLLPAVFGAIDLSTYPLSTVLRQGNGEIYTLHWSFNVQDETIRFAVNVSTTGWVGLGLSPNGGMADSDVAIGWVNSQGQAFLNDRHATTTARPPVDVQQDWFLDEGIEEGGFTILRFRRDWVTCDSQDREIKSETARVIFSWNDQDPADDDPNQVMYHGSTNRGTISLNLLGGQQDPPPDPVDLQTFRVTVDNINVPSSDTTYWCSAFELPEAIRNEKHFITKYSPFITPGNENHVHHILVYECDSLNDTHVGFSGPCNGGGEVRDMVRSCRGGVLISGWAVGGGPFSYPENVAYPVGGAGAPRYLVMETHYDNPGLSSNIMDSSGLEYSYTSTAREFEAGILQMGHAVTQYMVVPPGASNYNIFGECSGQCSESTFLDGGINIFANLLHTHVVGRGVTLRHIRNNTQTCSSGLEELKPIDQNLNYDFNYQENSYLPSPINVQPGDILRLECNYNTEEVDGVVLGGDSTNEEMCLSFPIYYPRINLAGCLSFISVSNQSLQPFISNQEFVPSNVLAAIISAVTTGSRSQFEAAMNDINWSQAAYDSLESSIVNGPITSACIPQEGEPTFETFPNGLQTIDCAYEAPDVCPVGGATSVSASVIVLLFSLAAVGAYVA